MFHLISKNKRRQNLYIVYKYFLIFIVAESQTSFDFWQDDWTKLEIKGTEIGRKRGKKWKNITEGSQKKT